MNLGYGVHITGTHVGDNTYNEAVHIADDTALLRVWGSDNIGINIIVSTIYIFRIFLLFYSPIIIIVIR